MSKSLGNFFTIREVTEKYHPEVLRMFMLGTHYRSPLDFSDTALDAAKASLDRLYETMKRCKESGVSHSGDIATPSSYLPAAFTTAMNDDFNTPEALACLFDICRLLNKGLDSDEDVSMLFDQFRSMTGVLGIVQQDAEAWFKSGDVDSEYIEALINERSAAKKSRDFSRADAIRDQLSAEGIILEDSPTGTTWKKS